MRLATALVLCLLLTALAGCGSGAARRPAPRQPAPPERREVSRTVGEFGTYGSDAGQLKEPFGIAVDQRSGDIYVVDDNNARIEKFTSAGKFLLGWGWGVANAKTQRLQTCRRKCFAGFGGSGEGQFQFAEGVAVNNDPASPSYRDVYVVEIQNYRVEKFSPTGKFLLMFGGGVNQTAAADHDRAEEDVCPVKRGDVCGKGVEGPSAGQFEFAVEGSFIAVGVDGTVYVGGRNRVKLFSPNGIYERQIELTPNPKVTEGEGGGVSGLAVNAAGDLYVIRHGIVGVDEYTPSGGLIRTLEPGGEPSYPEGPTPSLALDPAGNVFIDVYANYQHRIDEYSANGVKLASFDKGPRELPSIADAEDGLPGMAYDPLTKRLYLVNADVNVTPRVERVRILAPPQP